MYKTNQIWKETDVANKCDGQKFTRGLLELKN